MTFEEPAILADIDAAYHNGGAVKGSEAFAPCWTEKAEAFRTAIMADGRGSLDQAYGTAERQVYDLFLPVKAPLGLVVFIHGGYWMKLGKAFFSHLAEGPLARGYAVAMPNYTLAPDAGIGEIGREIGMFLGHIAEKVQGPITIAGHSAGGHLAARMISAPSPVERQILDRIVAVLAISGVHDLRPLMRTALNETLRLSESEARSESPALLQPATMVPVTALVGAEELPEFRRQTALLASLWYGLGVPVRHVEVKGKNHYDVIDDLPDGTSAMVGIVTPQPLDED